MLLEALFQQNDFIAFTVQTLKDLPNVTASAFDGDETS